MLLNRKGEVNWDSLIIADPKYINILKAFVCVLKKSFNSKHICIFKKIIIFVKTTQSYEQPKKIAYVSLSEWFPTTAPGSQVVFVSFLYSVISNSILDTFYLPKYQTYNIQYIIIKTHKLVYKMILTYRCSIKMIPSVVSVTFLISKTFSKIE